MRISKGFSNKISKINSTFCSERTKNFIFLGKIYLFFNEKHENCIKLKCNFTQDSFSLQFDFLDYFDFQEKFQKIKIL